MLKQPSLIDSLPAQYDLTTETIPYQVELRSGLVKMVVSKTNGTTGEITRFYLPGQWEPGEAAQLLHEIRGLSWQLGEEGVPVDFEEICDLCEEYLYEKVGYIEPISVKWRPKK
jgi:hypothetical protein